HLPPPDRTRRNPLRSVILSENPPDDQTRRNWDALDDLHERGLGAHAPAVGRRHPMVWRQPPQVGIILGLRNPPLSAPRLTQTLGEAQIAHLGAEASGDLRRLVRRGGLRKPT